MLQNLPEQEWVLVEGESDGHPYFMMVNDGFKDFSGKKEYSYCLITVIELNEVQDHKLPTDDEAEILNEMEELLISSLQQVTQPLEIGRETYLGEREILIYLPEFANYKNVIDTISKKLNRFRGTRFELHHDPIWKQATRYFGVQ